MLENWQQTGELEKRIGKLCLPRIVRNRMCPKRLNMERSCRPGIEGTNATLADEKSHLFSCLSMSVNASAGRRKARTYVMRWL